MKSLEKFSRFHFMLNYYGVFMAVGFLTVPFLFLTSVLIEYQNTITSIVVMVFGISMVWSMGKWWR
jgi:hypothetical protein